MPYTTWQIEQNFRGGAKKMRYIPVMHVHHWHPEV